MDVIISNCVINLSGDKRRVLAEAFRVLKPGGRFAVSDVIVREGLPEPVKASMELWIGCVAGALEEQEFISSAHATSASRRRASSRRASTRATTPSRCSRARGWTQRFADEIDGRIMSGFVRATKPGASAPRAATPARRLAVAAPAAETSTSTRACGCDDGCCT